MGFNDLTIIKYSKKMMDIFLLLLLAYSFCEKQPLLLQKYGSVKTTEINGLVYLGMEDFEDDSTIYIQFNVYNSDFYNRIIDYDFINFTPDSTYEPLRRMKPSSSSSSVTQGITGSSYAYYYYYKFTKQRNMKYLVMKYWDFYNDPRDSNSYLEIENTRNKWFIILIIILAIVVIIIILGIMIVCIMRHKGRRRNKTLINSQPDIYANQNKDQFATEVKPENQEEKPENQSTPYDQKQQYSEPQDQNNNYYEPPPINPINSSKTSSQCSIEKENY